MLPLVNRRLVPALIALLGAVLIVLAALIPEFNDRGVGVTPLDPERLGWVASLIGILVQVGLFLVPAVLLALGQARSAAAGILVGAGVLGLTVRLVRIVQLGQTPGFDAAIGSLVDLLADGAALTAGVLALTATNEPSDEVDWEDEDSLEAEVAPPPGEPDLE